MRPPGNDRCLVSEQATKQASNKYDICLEVPRRNKQEQGQGQGNERTTAVRDDLIVWRERCAWADLAAVGCERNEWLGTFLSLSGLQILGRGGLEGFPISLTDQSILVLRLRGGRNGRGRAVGGSGRRHPVSLSFVLEGMRKVRYGPDLVRMDGACDARLVS